MAQPWSCSCFIPTHEAFILFFHLVRSHRRLAHTPSWLPLVYLPICPPDARPPSPSRQPDRPLALFPGFPAKTLPTDQTRFTETYSINRTFKQVWSIVDNISPLKRRRWSTLQNNKQDRSAWTLTYCEMQHCSVLSILLAIELRMTLTLAFTICLCQM